MGMSCGWFRPIAGTHQEGNPRPPCVLPRYACVDSHGLPVVLTGYLLHVTSSASYGHIHKALRGQCGGQEFQNYFIVVIHGCYQVGTSIHVKSNFIDLLYTNLN